MLLGIEIALTISAWRAGWKAIALLPVGAAIALGLIISSCVSVRDGASLYPIALVIDVAVIIILAMMSTSKHHEGSVHASETN